ncbi:MAG: LpxL/LpxP family Kdo(2)-lipid IV(A) lauroyl/palmitoleoyl acyltransferase [Gammaproteobacteria bacterium]
MNAPPFRWALLSPHHWPAWLGVALLRLVCLLPIPWLVRLGEAIGWLFGKLAGSRRNVVRVNLKLCFPQQTEAEREAAIDAHFRALGAGLFEACLAWWATDEQLRRQGEVVGIENLQKAMADGHGVLLLTGHFTTLELCARYLLVWGQPFHAMYRPIKHPVMDFMMHRWRANVAGLPPLPREELRPLVRALREGRRVWYGPDQTLDRREGVFVPFFGVPTLMVTATSRIAQMGRAKVVPYLPERIGSRYRVTVLPALEDFPSGDDAADAARVIGAIEEGVRRAPAQYFWVHRRFKVRPPGEKSPY